ISFINMLMIPSGTYLWRIFFQTVFADTKRPKAISIMGAGEAGEAIYGVLRRKNDYVVKGIFDDDPRKWNQRIGDQVVAGPSSLVVDLAERDEIDAIVIAITHEKSSKLLKAVVHAKTKGIEVYDMPSLYQRLTGKLPVDHITDNWFVYNHLHGMDSNIYTKNVKRLIDIALSFTGLIVSLPVMMAVSVAIKLDSRGPVLFRQKRVGIDGKIYEIIKFRSMIKNAESNGAIWAQEDDPRVTGVGRLIRKTRMDEIPQMWNVLKGDMSFIGPRPERPEFVDLLNNEIPFYHLRHAIRPGITGWAQVNYRYGASKEDAIEKLQYDIYYMKNLSPFLDLHILLRTVRVVLFGMGAR
ncbi:MAG: sugar transferase, partial [Nitrospirota bacterium]|nr:sugar transferase [Nitrospirota bacterium]